MNTKIKNIGRIIIDCVYPPACAVCGKPLGRDSVPGLSGVHSACTGLLLPVSGQTCCKCGKSIDDNRLYCKDCEATRHTFTRAAAAYELNPELKDSLYRFKYKCKREYAGFFAKSIFKAHKNLLLFWQPELIIPIPMYYKKERARGYNQAALIAKELGREMDIPVAEDALLRVKKTVPLKDCSNTERREILSGAFKLSESLNVKKVLLVDDIYTTGATLDACATVLKEAGAEEVYGVNVCTGAGI